MDKKKNKKDIEQIIKKSRRQRDDKIKKLNDFRKDYNSEEFLVDLENYFGKEVDFNLDKIKAEISKNGRLAGLVDKACKKQTHPVIEFIQQVLKDL